MPTEQRQSILCSWLSLNQLDGGPLNLSGSVRRIYLNELQSDSRRPGTLFFYCWNSYYLRWNGPATRGVEAELVTGASYDPRRILRSIATLCKQHLRAAVVRNVDSTGRTVRCVPRHHCRSALAVRW